ncbi:360_t:CDS:2 [Diversispora eburnea]|uniref:BLOC-1-related complex subunit 7 n=1 Tax=Diversispora eburnea TaxID=1213867 RepID=A0A9N9CKJ6_9GLOM|nr:360_t:CDS:2 [Diversispora eburnea]
MKPELNEKSQNAFLGVRGIVKTVIRNSNVSEEVMRTAKLFANIDSLEKLTAGVTQLRERNMQMLDALYIVPQISDGLNVEELIKYPPLPPSSS